MPLTRAAAGAVYADERNLDGLLSLKRDMELHGPPVNALVYSMVLSGVFAATHDLEAVLAQWNAMLATGTRPDRSAYNALLRVYTMRDTKAAEATYQHMLASSDPEVQPN